MEALELLKSDSPQEQISAAEKLRLSVSRHPVSPVLEIWYAAKSLIDPENPAPVRTAGWELLTECTKHPSSTDLERREYFQTVAAPTISNDSLLQLSALVELSRHGRFLAGFEYDLIPLLTSWLQDAYKAARKARKNSQSAKGQKIHTAPKATDLPEDIYFSHLFGFLLDVIKFNFNNANESSVANLIDTITNICMNTSVENDLSSSIAVLDAIVTFGSIPQDKLKDCIQILSSIFCLVPSLQGSAWHTISNLCKSHNGQATVRIMLDLLRDLPADGSKDRSRNIRGALAVLQKLLSKLATETGYPMVPYALLVDGLSSAVKVTSSIRLYASILQLINALFDDGTGRLHPLILDESWSSCLNVAAECWRRAGGINLTSKRDGPTKADSPEAAVEQALLSLIARLGIIMTQKSNQFVPRESIIRFFVAVHPLLPEPIAAIILDYYNEFACCSPSDLQWEENLNLVLDAFFNNRRWSCQTRLQALKIATDAYELVDLAGDGADQNLTPRLVESVLENIADEKDLQVLEAITEFIVSVATSCDSQLFDYIVDRLRTTLINDERRHSNSSKGIPDSPIPSAPPEPASGLGAGTVQSSPSVVVVKAYIVMFMRLMNSHGKKSVRVFDALVESARSSRCHLDARLAAMKLLFRLRADWANRVFITEDPESSSLAAIVCRTEASFAKKQAEEASQISRPARNDQGSNVRSSRRASLGQGASSLDKSLPARTLSGAKSASSNYRRMWSYPDPGALPAPVPPLISPVLLSSSSPSGDEAIDRLETGNLTPKTCTLGISSWLDAVLALIQGSDWEIYSFVLVHLPSQLSNHAIFASSISQIQELRRLVCEQIRANTLQEPPTNSGLRRADVAICLFHSLTMILSYHEHLPKVDEDEIVKTFVQGIARWERTAKYCIHALSVCCHELPLSTSKSLIQILNQMAAIITQPYVSIHILEFLASLSRLPKVFVNFREDDYRIVFGICFRYLDYAKEKQRQSGRSSHASEASAQAVASSAESSSLGGGHSDDVPQYVHALAYHVILFWFLALKLPDRAHHVSWIVKKLFSDTDGLGQAADEQTLTSIDFMQRVTYADVEESAEDPYFTEDRFGAIVKKRWLVGNSIITIKQATASGWAQITKRQPSGTSAYTVRELFTPPPPHQTEAYVDVSREGQGTTNSILPSHLLVQLMSPVPQSFEYGRPIPLPEDEATERAIRVFDRNSSLDGHKVGVIYIGEGQTEEVEILANLSGSNDYLEFLNNLGTLTKLKGARFNTQGLDREYDTDGQYTFCWRDRVTEIVFHVTTQMPTNLERDPGCTLKKKHIGNDFVNIIFNDSGLPFKFNTFPSQFNLVNIVLTPASRASFTGARDADEAASKRQPFYRVQVMSKPGFPEVSPASEMKMISLKALPGFVRLLALNASMFSLVWHNREGGEHFSSWTSRLRELRRLRERHGPKAAGLSPSPPPSASPLGGSGQTQQTDGSRPSSSVRDSLNSLRRTSVATFFTSASELHSHRSSTVSGQAGTEAESAPTLGPSSLAESVDFSKWA